ncbi:hypothetical protein [Aliiglaciecola sp. LCG003]|uniref:hypothetical protein n=1 Tax=Aliiglaciecola sp. LCG003 TaxID=3053655 RepID=UPI002573BA5D|nr:hypothetical protein [Aliiglaciecola sp. LCG003]WJG10269.1 hypothetical protein QR722_04325 [Aliiglaciecola sp. LCG003]
MNSAQLHSELQLPAMPLVIEKLEDFVEQLYQSFEAQPRLVHLLLDAQLLPRIVNTASKMRYEALIVLLKKHYPHCDETLITQTAANLRYIMSASTWRYYRQMFDFNMVASVQCARMVIRQAIAYLNSK